MPGIVKCFLFLPRRVKTGAIMFDRHQTTHFKQQGINWEFWRLQEIKADCDGPGEVVTTDQNFEENNLQSEHNGERTPQ